MKEIATTIVSFPTTGVGSGRNIMRMNLPKKTKSTLSLDNSKQLLL